MSLPLIRARDMVPDDVPLPELMGPRESGEHRHVFDRLRPPGGRDYWCWCADCGAEWPEGGGEEYSLTGSKET